MKKTDINAEKFAESTGARRFAYIGGPQGIWGFAYENGKYEIYTTADLELKSNEQ